MRKGLIIFFVAVLVIAIKSCKKDPAVGVYVPTPYELKIPEGFPQMIIPADNPMTVEGVALGRKLFYEEKLSGDNTMSCATCHMQQYAFSENTPFSTGIDGSVGNRNAMALINLGWEKYFFWDGRAATLEDQIFGPVVNPIEMDESWANAMDEINEDPIYRDMFRKAFGTPGVDSVRASKAIAQFIRTLISGNSKFDKVLRGEVSFTSSESNGYDLFMRDKDEANQISGGDCFHCHGPILMSKQLFSNNGLDMVFADSGRGAVTGNPLDIGKFKAPTLRNIELTAPYMHDGRFATIDQVIEHYSTGVVVSPTLDPLMKFAADGGVGLTPQEKADVKAFLLTLTDYDFINNPEFKDPDQ
ncbi:MAG: cytochrome-c peroxidase [Bacteroidota bacterium]